MSTALITGGAGFIGSYLAESLLTRGDRVVILDNFDSFYPRPVKERHLAPALQRGAVLVEGDVTRGEDVERAFEAVRMGDARPRVVVHLAALAGVRPSIARPADYAHVNVTGTQVILDAAMRHGIERFIIASSSSVYGNSERVPFAEEDDVSRPISPYAATKVAAELLCRTAAGLHGLPITVMRIFAVFGPRQRPDLAIAAFLHRVAHGEPIAMYGDGTTSRDYVYIDDVIDGILRAIDRCGSVAPYRCYNLGGEHPATLAELIALIERTTGRRAIIERQAEQPGDVRRTWADLTRAREELDWQPKTPLSEGVRRQWEWMQRQPR